ncbi:hypothetical protein LCGC14_1239380 [marine sediment metagenome]|uniref:Uncharacterized protein n=1 Tax=marine sediment metagenome TaxID=412755 RepID=A0A0F9PAH4_9ZZZZ
MTPKPKDKPAGKPEQLKVYLFSNGNSAVFGDNDEQVAEFQTSWLLLFVQHLVNQGVNPLDVTYHMPDGRKASLFEIEDGYNWSIE